MEVMEGQKNLEEEITVEEDDIMENDHPGKERNGLIKMHTCILNNQMNTGFNFTTCQCLPHDA